MKINPVSSRVSFGCEKCERKKKFHRNILSDTGYAALGFGVASGVLGHQKKIKAHKITAGLALFSAAAHVLYLKGINYAFKHNKISSVCPMETK